MAYVKQTWIDHVVDEQGQVVIQGTKVDSAHLTHMEEGIFENSENIAVASALASAANSLATSVNQTVSNIISGAQKVGAALNADNATNAASARLAEAASKLANARKISLTGGATGNASFDGSKDISISVTALSPAKMSSGTLGNKINANAAAQVNISDLQIRDIKFGTEDLVDGVSTGQAGTLYGFYQV